MTRGQRVAPRLPLQEPWLVSYLTLVGLLLVARVLIEFVSAQLLTESQGAVFPWFTSLLIIVLGSLVLSVARETRLVLNWESPKLPIVLRAGLVGAGFGIGLHGLDVLFNLGIPHVPFPASLAFYAYGGILQEILLRVLPLTGIVWFVSQITPARYWQRRAFWVVAIVVSCYEPVGVLMFVSHLNTFSTGLVFLTVFGLNIVAAELYWRYGFYAAVTERFALYLVWHVVFAG